eukprot:CAMPEP_0180796900 /NCGR_PEP_ID=MMETSP1038_2-20121128/57065_1 /TAXON_ID=632150 /ORGANISM="Azadinium spinosum, Strain 3D9" /LENGTH=32 /DNA_ID= /DNA_START= /DNA_END= /DNA_ORIENTATION=
MTFKFWHLADSSCLKTLKGHTSGIMSDAAVGD